MMISQAHNLGCLIWQLSNLSSELWVDTKSLGGLDKATEWHKLKSFLIDTKKGALCIWTDGYYPEDNRSSHGEKHYKKLKSMGEYVTKSKTVNNPSGSPACNLYTWYFRREPRLISRSSKAIGGKTKSKKAPSSTY